MNYLTSAFDPDKPAYLTAIAGITNAKYAQLTEAAIGIYQQILKTFDRYGLQYFVFAGSMIGYVRNKQMMPWMDDIDVILFEEDIHKFLTEVVPELKKAGFYCFEPVKFQNGGLHILSLRESESKDAFVDFSHDVRLRVPRVQLDVFFTNTDSSGNLHNLGEWGLYNRKKIPVSWVKPGQFVNILGMETRVFSEYEKDIFHEYGDVLNNLLISTHGDVTLKKVGVPWSEIQAEYDELLQHLKGKSFPGLPSVPTTLEDLKGTSTLVLTDHADFIEILGRIARTKPSDIILNQPEHLFWAMDINKQFPWLKIHAKLGSVDYCSMISHFAWVYSSVETANSKIHELLCRQISALEFEKTPEIYSGSSS